ncbi:phosphotransferase [Leucobacter sp. HNU]|uniref:phosphotransferase n=1 Tax=Leucobacter sp. HNU TaxID=3236805 RepID=UPI003A7FFBEA
MASSPFTLAALATSAVPGLTVTALDLNEDRSGEFVSARIVGDGRDLLVRVPRTPAAEVAQSAELLSLAALAEGARAALPFAVPETLGLTRAGDSRAVVTTLLDGDRIDVEDLESDALVLQSIAETIAAIHALPTALVQQGGLPVRDAVEVRAQVARLVDRAQRTRLLPETVHHRWMEALESTALWDFAPAPVHGAFTAEVVLITDDRITGVLDWSEFSVGDPAADLAWLLAAGDEVFESVLARYAAISDTGHVGWLRARAKLYRELEVAEWLMHGVETHDQDIVSDAVAMLDRMVDRLTKLTSPSRSGRASAPRKLHNSSKRPPKRPKASPKPPRSKRSTRTACSTPTPTSSSPSTTARREPDPRTAARPRPRPTRRARRTARLRTARLRTAKLRTARLRTRRTAIPQASR